MGYWNIVVLSGWVGWSDGGAYMGVGVGNSEVGILDGEADSAVEVPGTASLDTEPVFRVKASAVVSRNGSSEAAPA